MSTKTSNTNPCFKTSNLLRTFFHARPWIVFLASAAFTVLLIAAGIFLRIRHRTFIIVDGKRIPAYSRGLTVEAILKQQNVVLGDKDIVLPQVSSPVLPGCFIHVTRVREETKISNEISPFCIIWRKKLVGHLRPVELQKGIQKSKYSEVRTVFRDGIEREKVVVKARETNSTLYRLVLLNKDGWAESIYDLSKCRKLKMVATAYYPGDPLAWKDGTVTFLGQKMQRGIVAVDPKVIPLRTRLYIPGYGYAYAGDTGSAIKNRRIDLGVNNAEEEKSYMHKPVTVYILENSPSW